MSVILCETEILHLFIGGDCTCLGCDPEWTCYCTASLLPHTISEWTRLEHTHTHTPSWAELDASMLFVLCKLHILFPILPLNPYQKQNKNII